MASKRSVVLDNYIVATHFISYRFTTIVSISFIIKDISLNPKHSTSETLRKHYNFKRHCGGFFNCLDAVWYLYIYIYVFSMFICMVATR